ncbi:hypothetical protein AS850_03590 [Frondihabitans sp. 762G35]|uniref:hypothetical protein n=1 Tax=Frondihabitans sp. 762G35 TaxID=1446794 RepID=UPI000D22B5E1|nr:hypothetical protein [Frondihabitans sp. 762G35]ARC56158.1 hypothetical protein AS850_03590 [Frondihabitans sp. 762G35]
MITDVQVDGRSASRDSDLTGEVVFEAKTDDGGSYTVRRNDGRNWTVTSAGTNAQIGTIHRIALSAQYKYTKTDAHIASGTQHDLWNAVESLVSLVD